VTLNNVDARANEQPRTAAPTLPTAFHGTTFTHTPALHGTTLADCQRPAARVSPPVHAAPCAPLTSTTNFCHSIGGRCVTLTNIRELDVTEIGVILGPMFNA